MVFLKDLFKIKATSLLFLFLIVSIIIAEARSTKIAYTKPIYGKTQIIKPKIHKTKTTEDHNSSTTTTTTLKALLETTTEKTTSTSTTPCTLENLDFAESTHALQTIKNTSEEQKESLIESKDVHKVSPQIEQTEAPNTAYKNAETQITDPHTIISSKEVQEIIEPELELPENHINVEQIGGNEHFDELAATSIVEHLSVEHMADIIEEPSNSSEHLTTTNSTTEGTSVAVTTASNRPIPCTCGIFMTSQIKRSKNPYESPKGKPVITNELDRTFPCNAVGQKQCQTKCLETIVQHLPNSANILCASIDRDIRKERAYLYIKNCRNQWYNTKLAAGREYCCKNGQPYQCPLV